MAATIQLDDRWDYGEGYLELTTMQVSYSNRVFDIDIGYEHKGGDAFVYLEPLSGDFITGEAFPDLQSGEVVTGTFNLEVSAWKLRDFFYDIPASEWKLSIIAIDEQGDTEVRTFVDNILPLLDDVSSDGDFVASKVSAESIFFSWDPDGIAVDATLNNYGFTPIDGYVGIFNKSSGEGSLLTKEVPFVDGNEAGDEDIIDTIGYDSVSGLTADGIQEELEYEVGVLDGNARVPFTTRAFNSGSIDGSPPGNGGGGGDSPSDRYAEYTIEGISFLRDPGPGDNADIVVDIDLTLSGMINMGLSIGDAFYQRIGVREFGTESFVFDDIGMPNSDEVTIEVFDTRDTDIMMVKTLSLSSGDGGNGDGGDGGGGGENGDGGDVIGSLGTGVKIVAVAGLTGAALRALKRGD